jgi:PAS domain S-box-containing protein
MSATTTPAVPAVEAWARLVRAVRGCGLVLVDAEGRVQMWSPGAEGLFGRSATEMTGASLAALAAAGEAERHWPADVIAALGAGEPFAEERWLRGPDGAPMRVSLVWSREGGEDHPPGYAVVLQDVTARWRAEEDQQEELARVDAARRDAEEAIRAREEFLATLSHELRTPLTAIVGWAHLLRTGTLDEANRARAVEIIERNARVEAQLTADILDVSRIITGKLRLDRQNVRPAAVVEAALDTVRQEAERKGVHLEVDLDGSSGVVRGDPDRLQQVVWNLLTNAVKFTPAGGCVRVVSRTDGGHEEIRVQDTGAGIAPEVVAHIFDRFWQGTGGRAGGLGLGLAIARHMVELHEGTLTCESAGPGQGSTFVVRLPRVNGSVSAPARSGTRTPLHGVIVLVVDDQEDARDLMSQALGACGADVVTAVSVADALAAFDRRRPDVILSDIEMPGEDGYSLIRRVRERGADRGGRVPAAALTAYARSEDRAAALAAGFQRHVAKPVDPGDLAAVVAALAGR